MTAQVAGQPNETGVTTMTAQVAGQPNETVASAMSTGSGSAETSKSAAVGPGERFVGLAAIAEALVTMVL